MVTDKVTKSYRRKGISALCILSFANQTKIRFIKKILWKDPAIAFVSLTEKAVSLSLSLVKGLSLKELEDEIPPLIP